MNLYGASGHAKVIIDIIKLSNNKVGSIYDDNTNIKEVIGHKVGPYRESKEELIISIGDNTIRKNISIKLKCSFGTAIHPNTIIDNSVEIEEGTAVMAGSIINSSSKIGKHCIVNTSSNIDHDCTLHDFVHLSPSVTLCGNVEVGEGSHIGAGATVIPGIKIGKWVTIGAGAVIIKDIPDNVTVVGNPGKVIK